MQLWILVVCGSIGALAAPQLLGMYRRHAARNRRRAELRQVLRTVREYEFLPVNVESLGEATRRQFERHTPAMLELGFAALGDFRMKPQPVEVHDRYFISPEGDIIGNITAVLEKGAVSFISVLADGTCVHTSSSKNPRVDRTFEDCDQLVLNYADNNDVGELYQLHQATLEEAVLNRGVGPLCFSAEQLRPVLVYDQRLFNRWRFRHGDFAQEPPAPEFATLEQGLESPVG